MTMTAFQGRAGTQGESMSEHDEGEDRFVSIGERLRRAREARAMSLDDVANQTRIPMRHLQHIEQEEWDALPAATYAIGFTRNYASAVGLDGPAIANELRDQIGGPRRRAPAPEYYEPADPARVPPRSLVIGVIILAILLIGGYVLWRNMGGAGTAAAPEETVIPVENGEAPAGNDQVAAPEALTGQTATLTSLGDVWISVSDGSTTLFSGILATGQTYTVPATATRPLLRTANPQLLRASAGDRDLGLIGPVRRTVSNVSLLPQDLATRASGEPPAAAAAPVPAPARTRRTAVPAPAPAQPQPQTPAPQAAPLSVPPATPQ
jgi:cytoskeletal protein RodZ